ncbi:MAG: flagellar hook basal-body protein [Gemmatimonadetes bacterium]|nr:flagellar hook basal-body protein [Gemmatimonadota bacterium]
MSSAAAALQMLQRRQEVLANNLANATTKGFKAESAFARLMDNALVTTDTALDLSKGSMTETHNALDLAVDGDGFFVVQTPGGDRFTRGGNFTLDADRRLVDGQGNPVLGDAGPITLPPGLIEIDKTGLITVDGKPQQRLRLETVAATSRLTHEGGTRFVPDATRKPVENDQRTIRQGFLEESNVNPMSAMTDMLAVLHRFGAAQKTISTLDAARGIAVTDLARPV